jgi:hypothetical protein
MARFRSVRAFHRGQYKWRAGLTFADSQANAQPGDIVLTWLLSSSLPQGLVPLDGSGTTMKNSSAYANEIIPASITGVDSIDS